MSRDFREVKGQEDAKRALEIAAAGGHNVLLVGPPGSGKSLLASRMDTILPPMTEIETDETDWVYCISGLPMTEGVRPFRSPHHTVSYAGMIGGGKDVNPGEVSLAHNGVLFLDEMLEFRRDVLEALRQPLEEGVVTVTRTSHSRTFPASFILIAAMNPCPCGYLGHPTKACRCTPSQVWDYQRRISGPLMDRVDLIVEVPSLSFDEMDAPESGDNSATIQERVQYARTVQFNRFEKEMTNSKMGPSQVQKHCVLDAKAKNLMRDAVDGLSLSGRNMHRILKTARTIADLAGSKMLTANHVAEAIQFRFTHYFETV